MMPPTLFIHIGAPKTGSTEIQRHCAQARENLATSGILYPKTALRGYGHHDIAFLLADGYPSWATQGPADLAEIEKGIAAEIAGSPASHVLLSSENFYLFPRPAELAELVHRTGLAEGREVRIVCYLRRQDRAAASWYNQMVKAQGYAADIATALSEMGDLWDYEARLSAWEKVFGSPALCIRRFEECEDFDVLHDFLSILDAPAPQFGRPVRANTGLNRDLLEIQRIFNGLPLTIFEKRGLHNEMIALSSASEGLFSNAPPMQRSHREEILAAHASGNRRLARRWFGEDVLFKSPPEADDPPYQGLSIEAIVSVLGWLLLSKSR